MRTGGMWSASLALILGLALSAPALADDFNFTYFGLLGASEVIAYTIDDNGIAGGTFLNRQNGYHDGFTSNPPSIYNQSDIDTSAYAAVTGLDGRGNADGFAYNYGSPIAYGFFGQPDGALARFTYPGAGITYAWGMNSSDVMVGQYYLSSSDPAHGFIYNYNQNSFTPFDKPGATETLPYGITAGGDIAGTYLDSNNGEHGFLYKNGTFQTIDVPGATATFVDGINSSDELVGAYDDASGNELGFVLANGVFTTLDVPGSVDTALTAINDLGTAVGIYQTTNSGYYGSFLVSVQQTDATLPEPGTFVTMAAGVLATLLLRRSAPRKPSCVRVSEEDA